MSGYTYAGDDPINKADPSGRMAVAPGGGCDYRESSCQTAVVQMYHDADEMELHQQEAALSSSAIPDFLGTVTGMGTGLALNVATLPVKAVGGGLGALNHFTGYGAFNKPQNGWALGYNWLFGVGPKGNHFGNGDGPTQQLEHSRVVGVDRRIIARKVADGEWGVGHDGEFNHSLGQRGDFSKSFAALRSDFTDSSTAAFLGSYTMNYKITAIDRNASTVTVNFTVDNTSTVTSAFRPPVIGYTSFWQNAFAPGLDSMFPSGSMSEIDESFKFTQTFSYVQGG